MKIIFLSAFPIFIWTQSFAASEFIPPAFTSPIVDQAQMIDDTLEQQLNQTMDSVYRNGGSQVAILTVPNLNGVPIESASIKTVEQWKLGTATKDNGVLLLVSKEDRSLRIEVGQGLEGQLTDLRSKQIVSDIIVPRFKDGEIDRGIVDGLSAIYQLTDPDAKLSGAFSDTRQYPASRKRDLSGAGIFAILLALFLKNPVILFFLFIFILSLGRRRRRNSFWGGGGFGGGGFGGGGFGGGGFGGGGFSGGGGGGFSGGGASGRW